MHLMHPDARRVLPQSTIKQPPYACTRPGNAWRHALPSTPMTPNTLLRTAPDVHPGAGVVARAGHVGVHIIHTRCVGELLAVAPGASTLVKRLQRQQGIILHGRLQLQLHCGAAAAADGGGPSGDHHVAAAINNGALPEPAGAERWLVATGGTAGNCTRCAAPGGRCDLHC